MIRYEKMKKSRRYIFATIAGIYLMIVLGTSIPKEPSLVAKILSTMQSAPAQQIPLNN